jgi:hypothetical protein
MTKNVSDFELPHHVQPLTRDEIMKHIPDREWQEVRLSMKGMPTLDKLHTLELWWDENEQNWSSTVQIVNYLNALKRGGQLSVDGDVQR